MKLVGYAMIAAPFVALFAFVAIDQSLIEAVALFAGVAFAATWLLIGVKFAA